MGVLFVFDEITFSEDVYVAVRTNITSFTLVPIYFIGISVVQLSIHPFTRPPFLVTIIIIVIIIIFISPCAPRSKFTSTTTNFGGNCTCFFRCIISSTRWVITYAVRQVTFVRNGIVAVEPIVGI